MQIGPAQIADEKLLKIVWKKQVRPVLRSMTFSKFNLATDPLHYAGYEWGMETLVATLAKDLMLGMYAPERGEIVRAAKAKGLSRPLCFLPVRDALVYRAITWTVSGQLMTDAQAWVGFTHSDKGTSREQIDDAGDSFDWFRFWLARQGHILQMVDHPDVSYFLESDIANFYPSIRLEAVREHLHSQTSLQKELVRLCVQIIDGVMPRRDYSEVSLMGLPQEQIGSSRDIAHSLLLHVDKEFEREGREGRYSRFMDDILIGVGSIREGEACVARLQRSLETLGLYPNAAKTTIVSIEEYLAESMVAVNAEIDRIEHELPKHQQGRPRVIAVPSRLSGEIASIAKQHRDAASPRPKRWDRVTRRLYTVQRRVGARDWWQHWRDDIDTDPGSAASILEYVRSWPLDEETATKLVELSVAYGGLYPDVSLLAAETIVSAPVPKSDHLGGEVFKASRDEFKRLHHDHTRGPDHERLAAGWLLASWKFANELQRREMIDSIPDTTDVRSPVRVQALPLLVAAGKSLSEWVSAKPGLAWENALAAEYLQSLQRGEERAVGVALNLIHPELRLAPPRYIILPRALPLVDILGKSTPAKLGKLAPRILSKLFRNHDRLRDHRTEFFLSQWCP